MAHRPSALLSFFPLASDLHLSGGGADDGADGDDYGAAQHDRRERPYEPRPEEALPDPGEHDELDGDRDGDEGRLVVRDRERPRVPRCV